MLITRRNEFSGAVNTMEMPITQEQLNRFNNRWQSGERTQDIFPELTECEQHFLLFGVTPLEYRQVHGDVDINCKGKSMDDVIIELQALPSDIYVRLIHWNGNEYVRGKDNHIRELEYLKNIEKRNTAS